MNFCEFTGLYFWLFLPSRNFFKTVLSFFFNELLSLTNLNGMTFFLILPLERKKKYDKNPK